MIQSGHIMSRKVCLVHLIYVHLLLGGMGTAVDIPPNVEQNGWLVYLDRLLYYTFPPADVSILSEYHRKIWKKLQNDSLSCTKRNVENRAGAMSDDKGGAMHENTGEAMNEDREKAKFKKMGVAKGEERGGAMGEERGGAKGEERGGAMGEERGGAKGEERGGAMGEERGGAKGEERGGAMGEERGGAKGEERGGAMGEERGGAMIYGIPCGIIHSQSPPPYSTNWTLTVHPFFNINITFGRFHLRDSLRECVIESVWVSWRSYSSENWTHTEKQCGPRLLWSVYIPGSESLVHYQAIGGVKRRGQFTIYYQIYKSGAITGVAENYRNVDFRLRIKDKDGDIIHLQHLPLIQNWFDVRKLMLIIRELPIYVISAEIHAAFSDYPCASISCRDGPFMDSTELLSEVTYGLDPTVNIRCKHSSGFVITLLVIMDRESMCLYDTMRVKYKHIPFRLFNRTNTLRMDSQTDTLIRSFALDHCKMGNIRLCKIYVRSTGPINVTITDLQLPGLDTARYCLYGGVVIFQSHGEEISGQSPLASQFLHICSQVLLAGKTEEDFITRSYISPLNILTLVFYSFQNTVENSVLKLELAHSICAGLFLHCHLNVTLDHLFIVKPRSLLASQAYNSQSRYSTFKQWPYMRHTTIETTQGFVVYRNNRTMALTVAHAFKFTCVILQYFPLQYIHANDIKLCRMAIHEYQIISFLSINSETRSRAALKLVKQQPYTNITLTIVGMCRRSDYSHPYFDLGKTLSVKLFSIVSPIYTSYMIRLNGTQIDSRIEPAMPCHSNTCIRRNIEKLILKHRSIAGLIRSGWPGTQQVHITNTSIVKGLTYSVVHQKYCTFDAPIFPYNVMTQMSAWYYINIILWTDNCGVQVKIDVFYDLHDQDPFPVGKPRIYHHFSFNAYVNRHKRIILYEVRHYVTKVLFLTPLKSNENFRAECFMNLKMDTMGMKTITDVNFGRSTAASVLSALNIYILWDILQLSWEEAKRVCASIDGHLPSTTHEDDLQFWNEVIWGKFAGIELGLNPCRFPSQMLCFFFIGLNLKHVSISSAVYKLYF